MCVYIVTCIYIYIYIWVYVIMFSPGFGVSDGIIGTSCFSVFLVSESEGELIVQLHS